MSDDATDERTDAAADDGIDASTDASTETSADASADAPVTDGVDDSGDIDDSDDDSDDDATDEDGDGEEGGENPLDTEGEIAADYLEELLDIADFDGDIDTYVEGNRPHVSVLTEGDVLVGSNGEVLDALQELSRLAVMTETGNRSRLMLDIGGYREKRRQELVELAGDAIQEVQGSGDSVRLQPMNPFERKIVHDAVAAAGLISESEGEEPRRRVVVMPKA